MVGVIVAHVESPRRNVDELATPDPSRAVAIVPEVISPAAWVCEAGA